MTTPASDRTRVITKFVDRVWSDNSRFMWVLDAFNRRAFYRTSGWESDHYLDMDLEMNKMMEFSGLADCLLDSVNERSA